MHYICIANQSEQQPEKLAVFFEILEFRRLRVNQSKLLKEFK